MGTIDDLKEIVGTNQDDLWNVSETILKYIFDHKTEEQLSIFTTFLKDIDFFDFDFPDLGEQFSLTDDNYEELKNVSATAKRIIQNLIDANVTEPEFYSKLWNKLNDQDLFPDADDRTALLFSLWLDRRIPYYQLGESCSMDNDEYRERIQKLTPELKKASFIIYSGLQQKTQRASLLMSLADKIEDDRQRAVFWSCVISKITEREARKEAERMLEQLDEGEDEEED